MKREKLIPLNIQLFADGDGDGSSETSKTYSQEEMDKIIADLEKIKKANDNLSKENADYKRKTKEKMSEEEKKAKEQEEKDKLLADAQKELLSIKISKEFMVAGFDEKSTAEIVETFNTGDSIAFAKALSTHIQKLVENVRKEEKENFQRSSKIPPTGSGKQTSGLDPQVERYINNKKSNSNSAREMLFGKK